VLTSIQRRISEAVWDRLQLLENAQKHAIDVGDAPVVPDRST
jgi:hypothetical protein